MVFCCKKRKTPSGNSPRELKIAWHFLLCIQTHGAARNDVVIVFLIDKTDGTARDFHISDVLVFGIASVVVVVDQVEALARIGFESCIVKHVVVLLIIFFDKNAISYYTTFLSFFQYYAYIKRSLKKAPLLGFFTKKRLCQGVFHTIT